MGKSASPSTKMLQLVKIEILDPPGGVLHNWFQCFLLDLENTDIAAVSLKKKEKIFYRGVLEPSSIRARWDSRENEILHLEFWLICIWKQNSILETFRKTTFLIRGHFDRQTWSFKFGRKYKGFSKLIKKIKMCVIIFSLHRFWKSFVFSAELIFNFYWSNWPWIKKVVLRNVSKI